MQKQQTTLQKHLQMFAKGVGPGWSVCGEKAPLPSWLWGTDPATSAARVSSPGGGHQMLPQMAESRGQALTGTALPGSHPEGLGPSRALLRAPCSPVPGVRTRVSGVVQSSLQMGRTAQGSQDTQKEQPAARLAASAAPFWSAIPEPSNKTFVPSKQPGICSEPGWALGSKSSHVGCTQPPSL